MSKEPRAQRANGPADVARPINTFYESGRGNYVRLRTMILLRWVAVFGQITAITAAVRIFDLTLPFGLIYLAIGVSVAGNLLAMFLYPETKRLSESENFLMVFCDLAQLGFLLALTGGLHNPFALLVLGPATISAGVLRLRSTLILSAITILIVTALARYHIPLVRVDGEALTVSAMFLFGTWAAIVIGVVFLGVYSRWVADEMHQMRDALQATQLALAREQKLTDLGGVVAAAAHELGSPLATITLTSSELAEELDAALPERTDLIEDAKLIRAQADRCRDILHDMGRAGKDDLHLQQAPLSAVLREAAEPHEGRGKEIRFEEAPGPGGEPLPPAILRRPEIIHGLRNLIQNAVDFSDKTVRVEAIWTDDLISLRILDDGPGYPPHLLGRLGDPFTGKRRPEGRSEDYQGMGLGLFIAKTMLERTGAELSFANGRDPWTPIEPGQGVGAVVEVVWPRSQIDARHGDFALRPGVNRPITG